MQQHELVSELNHSAYHQAAKIRGYRAPISVFQAHSVAEAAQVLRHLNGHWSKAEHEELAAQHAAVHQTLVADWQRLSNEAALETFGRPWSFFDYQVSGIGRSEFSEPMKAALRFAAHAASHHQTLALAHGYAARRLRLH